MKLFRTANTTTRQQQQQQQQQQRYLFRQTAGKPEGQKPI